jgi:hypothetical protein
MKLSEIPIHEKSGLPLLSDFVVNDEQIFKGNIPDTMAGWVDGNGEGVWLQGLTEEDTANARDDNYTGTIQVILRNSSVYWSPMKYGTVLQFTARGNKRPVLDIDWVQEHLAKIDVDFKQILTDGDKQ